VGRDMNDEKTKLRGEAIRTWIAEINERGVWSNIVEIGTMLDDLVVG
jgi:hypothetical protein